ncbi:RecQ family ATP-dependent DNA helicase [soil metagenome]
MISRLLNRMAHNLQQADAAFSEEARRHLKVMLGSDAEFRNGQLEAILALVEHRSRLLVVQKTGWGKSLVYFIATRMLRDRGLGTTFLISPLLSLMRNQEQMAARIGVKALRLDSSNRSGWPEVMDALREGTCDLLLVSPERLANDEFRTETLPAIQQGLGMMVVDEAHCISDWGHDFRPDYRRIVQIVRVLPTSIPVLATTATANDRVVADIKNQIGDQLFVQRGEMSRSTLRLQCIELGSQASRLAWLATHLPTIPGTGIIYCLTVRDTHLIERWMQHRGIDVSAYNADLPTETREILERRLLANDVKALAAIVALGMGFDKPDLGFVIHFQRPGSVISYYQQIGRSGRAGQDSLAILLRGDEDDVIQDYFISIAFPSAESQQMVLDALSETDGMTIGELERVVNVSHRRLEQCLKFLEVEGAVVRDRQLYQRTPIPWKPDLKRAEQVTRQRFRELETMQEFVSSRKCLMEFVARQLDDHKAKPCGRCANCAGDVAPRDFATELETGAEFFSRRSWISIKPRKMLPPGALPDRPRKIEAELLVEPGIAVCSYSDSGLGDLVQSSKYKTGRFDDRLLDAAAEAILATWKIDSGDWWVTAVPSLRLPEFVGTFAEDLAVRLDVPFSPALVKRGETAEQKLMHNSAMQFENIIRAFVADEKFVQTGPVILVDDLVDSGRTMAVCGARLRKAGSGPVHPFALATFRQGTLVE